MDVNISLAYDQWTRFEDFPRFMAQVEHVRQLDAATLRWTLATDGDHTFSVEVTEQVPERRIAWRAAGGTRLAAIVTLHALDDGHTSVMLRVDVEPTHGGAVPPDALGAYAASVAGDLRRFKQLVQQQDAAAPASGPDEDVSELGGSLRRRPLHPERRSEDD